MWDHPCCLCVRYRTQDHCHASELDIGGSHTQAGTVLTGNDIALFMDVIIWALGRWVVLIGVHRYWLHSGML